MSIVFKLIEALFLFMTIILPDMTLLYRPNLRKIILVLMRWNIIWRLSILCQRCYWIHPN